MKIVRRLGTILQVGLKYKLYQAVNKDNLLQQDFPLRLRAALEELGPIFIKFGQLLSTRHDLLPGLYTSELSKLQDQVKPFSNSQAKAIIKKDLNKEYDQLFSNFSEQPIASASVAQVYTARVDEHDIIVKILRPELRAIITTDLKLLGCLIQTIKLLIPGLKRFKPDELLLELHRVLNDEQDLLREAANCSQLRRNFLDSKILYIPKIYWQYCSKNILVAERILGISINDISELKKLKVDLKLLARRGLEVFFTQVFEHCLFHGDLHPGNIFVDATLPYDPKFIAVDFGIVGSLGPDEQYYLASNLLAFLNRDYRRVAELHIESGWVDGNTRVDLFESAIRTVSEPILELPVSQISFGELLVQLFDVARSFNMQLQPQLLVFKKSLINVEAIAHRLDPELDIWATAKPHIEIWMNKKISLNSLYDSAKYNLPDWLRLLKQAPRAVHSLTKANNTDVHTQNMASESAASQTTNKLNKFKYKFIAILSSVLLVFFNYYFILEVYKLNRLLINNILLFSLLALSLLGYNKQEKT